MSSQSGVKLAPPIFTASVTSFEKRTSDDKVWYTVEVVPKANIIESRSGVKHPMNRKPYEIFRRYEDFCEFAQRLNSKFPRLYGSSHYEKDTFSGLHVYSESISTPSRSTLLSKSLSESQLYTKTTTAVQTDPDSPGSDSIVSLPKIKPLWWWTLFRGNKAACVNKQDLFNHFVKALFQFPAIITNSSVVIEFFGIWKQDVDYKLVHNMNDPVALSTPMFKILMNLDHPASQKFVPERNQRKYNSEQDSSDEDHSGRVEAVPFSGSALWMIASHINLVEEEDICNALSKQNSLNEMAYSGNDGFDEHHHQGQRRRRRSGILPQAASLPSLEYSEKPVDENDATLDERGFQPSSITSTHVISDGSSSLVHDPDYFNLTFERTSFLLTPLAQSSPRPEYSSALGRRQSSITDRPTYENLKTFRSSFSNTSSTFSTPRSILSECSAQHRPWLPRHSTFGTCQPGLQADRASRSLGDLMTIVDSESETPSDDSFVGYFPIPSPVPIHLRIDSNTPNPNALNIKVILDSDTTIVLEVPRDISLRRLRARIAAKLARSGHPSPQDDFVLFYNNTVEESTLPDFSLSEKNDLPVNQQAYEEPCEKACMDSQDHCRFPTNIYSDCHIHVSDKSGNPTLEYNPSDGYENDDIIDYFVSVSDDKDIDCSKLNPLSRHSVSPHASSDRLSGFLITNEDHLRLAIRSCWIEGQITLRCIL